MLGLRARPSCWLIRGGGRGILKPALCFCSFAKPTFKPKKVHSNKKRLISSIGFCLLRRSLLRFSCVGSPFSSGTKTVHAFVGLPLGPSHPKNICAQPTHTAIRRTLHSRPGLLTTRNFCSVLIFVPPITVVLVADLGIFVPVHHHMLHRDRADPVRVFLVHHGLWSRGERSCARD